MFEMREIPDLSAIIAEFTLARRAPGVARSTATVQILYTQTRICTVLVVRTPRR